MSHATRVCPDDILALFKGDDASKARGRAQAARWMAEQTKEMVPGDEILIPHPVTGELESHILHPQERH